MVYNGTIWSSYIISLFSVRIIITSRETDSEIWIMEGVVEWGVSLMCRLAVLLITNCPGLRLQTFATVARNLSWKATAGSHYLSAQNNPQQSFVLATCVCLAVMIWLTCKKNFSQSWKQTKSINNSVLVLGTLFLYLYLHSIHDTS